MKKHISVAVLAVSAAFTFASAGWASAQESASDDVVARVGDQTITHSEINTMMNSSAVVGLSVPALGTPDRQRAHLMLLDKVISANLLYLDARDQGLDKDPAYQRDLREFADGVLASLYRKRHLYEGLDVSDQEIEAFRRESVVGDAPLSDEARTQIAAVLRKRKLDEAHATERERLRAGLDVSIDRAALDPADDDVRADGDVLARYGDQTLTWADASARLLKASAQAELANGRLDAIDERVEALNRIVDIRVLADKARAEGIEQDAVYRRRFDEYRKTQLINERRARLLAGFEPDEKAIDAYFKANAGRISQPEERKIQMIVLGSRDEAEAIKARIDAGELTLYQAAAEYSIDPRAKETLGEMGWVGQGSGFPELDKMTFALGPDELGGPVESPAGWHLVKVLDVRDARFQDVTDENTRRFVRRTLMREKLDDYLVDLRLKRYKVEVYEDRLNRNFAQEAAWIDELEKKAQEPSSVTAQREEALKKLMQQP